MHRQELPPLGAAIAQTNNNDAETARRNTVEPGAPRGSTSEEGPPGTAGRRMLIDRRSVDVAAEAERVFAQVERLGGRSGWPVANVLWRLRGMIDRLVGGIGMRLGRRDPEHLRVGDAVDFWRVEALDRPRLLRLRAQMRVPGFAWLEYQVDARETGSRLTQTAYFLPRGLAGYSYWYLLLPIHAPIFRGTVRALARRSSSA
jgi:uncharacterized protein DUF2867